MIDRELLDELQSKFQHIEYRLKQLEKLETDRKDELFQTRMQLLEGRVKKLEKNKNIIKQSSANKGVVALLYSTFFCRLKNNLLKMQMSSVQRQIFREAAEKYRPFLKTVPTKLLTIVTSRGLNWESRMRFVPGCLMETSTSQSTSILTTTEGKCCLRLSQRSITTHRLYY